jgi:hypothetical protein
MLVKISYKFVRIKCYQKLHASKNKLSLWEKMLPNGSFIVIWHWQTKPLSCYGNKLYSSTYMICCKLLIKLTCHTENCFSLHYLYTILFTIPILTENQLQRTLLLPPLINNICWPCWGYTAFWGFCLSLDK